MQTGQLLNPAMRAHNLHSAIPAEVAYCVDASARGRLSLRQSWEDIRNSEAGEPRSTGIGSGAIRQGGGKGIARGADRLAGDSSGNLTTSPRRMRDDDPGQVRAPTEAVAIVPLMDRATTPPVTAPPTDARNGTWPGPLRLSRPQTSLLLSKTPVLPFLEPELVVISGVEVPGLRTSASAIGLPVHPKSLSLQLFPRRRVVVAVTRRSGRSREHASGVLS